MHRRLVCAPSAELRLREAAAWLAARPPGEEVLVIGATHEAASEVIRTVAVQRGTGFGWHRLTLGRLAAELARPRMADEQLAPVGMLVLEALCARVVHRLRGAGKLVRLDAVAEQPGLPRALARTLHELRMAGASALPPGGDAELDLALRGLVTELAEGALADRARVFELATAAVHDTARRHPLCALPMLVVDVPVRTEVEQRLLAALVERAPRVLATVPAGDDASRTRLEPIVGAVVDAPPIEIATAASLARVQALLFSQDVPARAELDESVTIFSAPGESRECVEIARRVMREAARGVPFDRMAVLLRAPAQYRVHLEEAFARAGIDAYFEQGTVRPDPAGRAFVALLACKAEGLSARRFAEYLSLGEVPDAAEGGAPPDAPASGDRWVPPDEDLLPRSLAPDRVDDPRVDLDAIAASIRSAHGSTPVTAGTLRAPWRWERLLVDASVIGGRDRWQRRLAGLEARMRLEHDDGDPSELRVRALVDLDHLRRFALPLLDELDALPARAKWGAWLDRLSALATRALRRPERVLQTLGKLAPTAEVGPVELAEVLLVLAPQLEQLEVQPPLRRYGRVLVAPIEAARGLAFDVVFVPGLAERMFPQKIIEDPLLLDAERARLAATGLALPRRDERLSDERLALRIALGAARQRVVLSYPRIDLEQGRPRVPSFYGLEVLEAAEGALPDFDELGRRADITGAARIAWPAPADRLHAVDEAEHDLALLGGLMSNVEAPAGAAAYLVNANVHLARALRFRARRWTVKSWKPADGLVVESAPGIAALARHAPSARAFSPTALEQLATCPYRFALRAILRLEPREQPESIEQLGALERGSLIHEIQFELLSELRDASELPVRADSLAAARARLDVVLDRVAARYRDELCPAIDRVWDDGIAAIRADLREWLRRLADDTAWIPERFELGFGPVKRGERDPASTDDEVPLDIGLSLRGSIDLVERAADGTQLRATDHKSGSARVSPSAVIAGGASLQPVLYALVLEKLFPAAQVAGGRLFYCTTRGNFSEVIVPLDAAARAAAKLVASTLAYHFEHRFFPAAPLDAKTCSWCDYRSVCGSQEPLRTKKKAADKLVPLDRLRGAR